MGTRVDRDAAETAFGAYVARYGKDNPRVVLKVDHTLRVAASCDAIARSVGLPPCDVDLAWLCGLLHDIGRFEQLRRWDTFNDALSASHAALGVDALFGEDGAIREFVADDSSDEAIRLAVGLHSDFRLPDRLDDRVRTLCVVVRDADKIEIVRDFALEPPETIFGAGGAELCRSRISGDALRAFYEHRCVRRDERHEPADTVLGILCFAFELEFPVSLRILHDQGLLYELMERPLGLELPFADARTQVQFEAACAHLREWMRARV